MKRQATRIIHPAGENTLDTVFHLPLILLKNLMGWGCLG